MPAVSQLMDIALSPGEVVVADNDGSSHFYHQVAVSREHGETKVVGVSMPGAAFAQYAAADVARQRLAEEPPLAELDRELHSLVFGGLAMGHHWAVHWMQVAHRSVLQSSGFLGDREAGVPPGECPRWRPDRLDPLAQLSHDSKAGDLLPEHNRRVAGLCLGEPAEPQPDSLRACLAYRRSTPHDTRADRLRARADGIISL